MSKLSILVVDDDRDFAETVSDVLKLKGYAVDVAWSGEEGIDLFSRNEYDVVFMDVKLPGLNGLESFLEIRKIKSDARVIMMTGYSVETLLDQALSKGAWRVIRKPFDMRQVIDLLQGIEPGGVVLVVDDDPDFSETICNILATEGYLSLVAHDGKEALEKARDEHIDLMLLDLRLPLLHGLAVFMELRKRGCDFPTIIVTAYPDDERDNIDVLRQAEVTGVLIKPVAPERLLQLVLDTIGEPG